MHTQQQVIQHFIDKHGYLYDYSKVNYINNCEKVTIICKEHGEFKQEPRKHKSGNGCPACNPTQKLTTSKLINQFIKAHDDLYDYSLVNYINSLTKVTIICKKHGKFEQSPYMHKEGHGCRDCGYELSTFSYVKKYYNKPTIVYFLHIKDDIYKVGITTRPVQERIEELDYPNIKVVRTKQFETGKEAYIYEQKILNKFKAYRYQGKDILSSGNSELFELI